MIPSVRNAPFLPRPLLVATFLLLSWLGSTQATTAQEQPTLAGTLQNGTANAVFAPDLVPVTLRTFEGPVQIETRVTHPTKDGRFEFAGVTSSPGRTYFFSADYQGVGYSATLSGEQLAGPVTLTVYESTANQEALSVISHAVIITGADSRLRVAEVLERVSLANPTDRTFVPDLQGTGMANLLRFALPPTPTTWTSARTSLAARCWRWTWGLPSPRLFPLPATFRTSWSSSTGCRTKAQPLTWVAPSGSAQSATRW